VIAVDVLGSVRAVVGGAETTPVPPGPRAVLGLLALHGGAGLSRDALIDALWPARPPVSAVNVLQTHVKLLRRLLEPGRERHERSGVVVRAGDGYALRLPADAVDVERFRHLVAAALRAQHAGDTRGAAARLSGALRLWRGRPLADLPALASHPAVLAAVAERHAARARCGELLVAAGLAAEAVAPLEEAAAEQPLDEAAQARLIRAYRAAGLHGRALRTYDRSHRRLVDDLGVDPGPELASAHSAVLRDLASPSRPTPAQLPGDVPHFVGREPEQAMVLERLSAGDGAAVCLVSGTAGVGKTALAVRCGHRVRERFPDGQLYVDLRGVDARRPLSPAEALTRLLGALGVAPQHVPDGDADALAARYRTEMSGRRVLVVLDDAGSVEQVRPLLPGSASCGVVVTSRESLPGLVSLHGVRRVALDVLPEHDCVRLLRVLLGRSERAGPVRELAEQCARLPLALRLAAEFVTSRGGGVSALIGEPLARRLVPPDATGDDGVALPAVFSPSYRRLPPEAATLFRRLALHRGPDVDHEEAAALTATTPAGARRALEVLTRAHLVRRTGPGRWGAHALLRAYAAVLCEREDSADDRAAALARLAELSAPAVVPR
jgi:DNA-binding SARP family transcriptional activator